MSTDTLTDVSGYVVQQDELRFLGISDEAIANMRMKRCPLGMEPVQFEQFTTSLEAALGKDGITSYDVRLQGSSAHLFSGAHKTMPWNRDSIVEEFRRSRRRLPLSFEINLIADKLDQVWPAVSRRPYQRPFDVMFRCGIDRYPSDYDIQISSDDIAERAQKRIADLGIAPAQRTVNSNSYNFIRKDLIVETCPHLTQWAILQTDILGRLVTIAAFPAAGPPNVESTKGSVSSHLKKTDWILLKENRLGLAEGERR